MHTTQPATTQERTKTGHGVFLRTLQPYILTYLLTPRSRVLLEKLTGFQLVKKFPAFYGTRRFFTAFTNSRHLSLSWARSIQPKALNPTSWRSILILSSHLRLVFQVVLSFKFPHWNSVYASPLPFTTSHPVDPNIIEARWTYSHNLVKSATTTAGQPQYKQQILILNF
jgi:hypothetical protein